MADNLVLQCVVTHNRPFNVQCVADLLATKGVKKAQAQRSLDALSAAGKLRCKEFGKTKLYYPNQDTEVLNKEELAQGRQAVADLTQQAVALSQRVDEKQKELSALKSAQTVEQLQQTITSIDKQVVELDAKLGPLRDQTQTISKADNDALEAVFNTNMDAWQRRKRMFNSVWDTIAEGLDRKEAEVFEEIGVDTDAAMKVSYKEFAHLVQKRRR